MLPKQLAEVTSNNSRVFIDPLKYKAITASILFAVGFILFRSWRYSCNTPGEENSLIRRTWAPGIRIFDSDLIASASRPSSAAEKRCSRHPRAPNESACIHAATSSRWQRQRPAAWRPRPEHRQPPASMGRPRFQPGRTLWPATSRLWPRRLRTPLQRPPHGPKTPVSARQQRPPSGPWQGLFRLLVQLVVSTTAAAAAS